MMNVVVAIALMCQVHAPSTGQDKQIACSQKLLKCYLRTNPSHAVVTANQETEKLLACIDAYRGEK